MDIEVRVALSLGVINYLPDKVPRIRDKRKESSDSEAKRTSAKGW